MKNKLFRLFGKSALPTLLAGALLAFSSPVAALAQGHGGGGHSGGRSFSSGSSRGFSGGGRAYTGGRSYGGGYYRGGGEQAGRLLFLAWAVLTLTDPPMAMFRPLLRAASMTRQATGMAGPCYAGPAGY